MNPSCWLHSSQFKRLNRRQRRIGRLSDKNVSGAGKSRTLPSVGSLMPCRKIPSVCTKSSVRVTWCYIPNCTPRSHGAGLLYQQARRSPSQAGGSCGCPSGKGRLWPAHEVGQVWDLPLRWEAAVQCLMKFGPKFSLESVADLGFQGRLILVAFLVHLAEIGKGSICN